MTSCFLVAGDSELPPTVDG